MRAVRLVALAAVMLAATVAAEQFPAKEYGYVPINDTWGSSMFYALRGNADLTAAQRGELPLVMWLQGGPGGSSLFGDFLENGPVKLAATGSSSTSWALSNRTFTWTNYANMLYVDNPVGTGFSYTTNPQGFSQTDQGIADNLLTFLKGFLAKHSEFQNKPFWVFCESYGGKMTSYFGATLMKAVQAGTIASDFKGVALGDGWVDPIGCMASYGPYLQAFSQLTKDQVGNVTAYATAAQQALNAGNGDQATNLWGNQQSYIDMLDAGANWYNVLYYYDYTPDNQFSDFAQTQLTEELGDIIPTGVYFGSQAGQVFSEMNGAFMKDSIQQVQEMIDGGLQVNVYGGQVDLIVDSLCIQGWLKKLPWTDLSEFFAAARFPFQNPNAQNVAGFVQSYKNFAFWNINKAGHMVPLDQPWAAEYMFTTIIGATMSPASHAADPELTHDEKKPRSIHRRRVAQKP